MRGNEVRLEHARQNFAVHIFWDRYSEQVKNCWCEIDKPRVLNLRTSYQNGPSADQNSVKPVRPAPFAVLRRLMLTNYDRRLVLVLFKAWQGGKQAIFAPPIEDDVGGFSGKRAMENLIALINAGNYGLSGARIFQFAQFLDDEIGQRSNLCRFHNALAF